MRSQIVYETNIDYEKTYESLSTNPSLVTEKTGKGLIWFRFKETSTIFIISPNGKMQVKWNSLEEKKVLLKLVRNLAVPNDSKLTIRPEKQQVWIVYPPPEGFKLYWCDETVEYEKKTEKKQPKPKLISYLEKKYGLTWT